MFIKDVPGLQLGCMGRSRLIVWVYVFILAWYNLVLTCCWLIIPSQPSSIGLNVVFSIVYAFMQYIYMETYEVYVRYSCMCCFGKCRLICTWLLFALISQLRLNLNLNLKIVYSTRKKITNMTQYHTEYMTVCFLLSGDPYKGAERTACVRATHGYYNA